MIFHVKTAATLSALFVMFVSCIKPVFLFYAGYKGIDADHLESYSRQRWQSANLAINGSVSRDYIPDYSSNSGHLL